MSTFVVAAFAAVSGGLAGLAIGAQLSRLYGPAPSDTPRMFAISSTCALVATIGIAFLL